MSTPDYVNMTDEELMALDAPEELNLASLNNAEPPLEEQDDEDDVVGDDEGAADDHDVEAAADEDEHVEDEDEAEAEAGASDEGEDGAGDEGGSAAADDHTTPQHTDEGGEADKAEAAEPDYKALYEQLMTPFKANGRTFTPTSPEEVQRLMQMGANYTKKMQGLQPHLKAVRMLENNGLLDEQKLSYLIDLDQKNPEAIKKLVRDSKIDPMDIDVSEDSAYRPGNHSVSDQDMALSDALDTVRQTPSGIETIRTVDKTWDPASKSEIAKDPSILSLINDHRAAGIYDRINDEIERRKILGLVSTNVPFLHAYKAVGDELHAEGKLIQDQASAGQPTNQAPTQHQPVVSTRVPRTSKPAATREQVRAVSSAPGTRAKAKPKPSFNPLEMSDEEIMAMAPPTKL